MCFRRETKQVKALQAENEMLRNQCADLQARVTKLERSLCAANESNSKIDEELARATKLFAELDEAIEALPMSVLKWTCVKKIVSLMNEAGREIDFVNEKKD